MKKQNILIILSLVCIKTMTAQEIDSSYMSVDLTEITVTQVPSSSRMILSSIPVSAITIGDLNDISSTNIINALCIQPGVSEITTGTGISKPVIRGLGYNRLAVVNDGIRQEGNQWGDEHGIEIDENSVDSVEIIKGPMSLMYGSDAMAGVIIMHDKTVLSDGTIRGSFSSQYQTNNGLAGSSLSLGYGTENIFVDGQVSAKAAHAYTNKIDGYIPGSGFAELAGKVKTGIERKWGHTYITGSFYNLNPGIIEGERDSITGELVSESDNLKSYELNLPYQKIRHYKGIVENGIYRSAGMIKTILGYQLNSRMEFEESEDECALHFLLHTLNYDVHFISKKRNEWQYSYGVNGMAQNSLNRGEEVLIPEFRLLDIGAFAMASKNIGRWSINGGARYDIRTIDSDEYTEEGTIRFTDFTRTFNSFSGSIGTIFTCSDACALKLNMARGYRAPNMSELASNGVHEGSIRYELGDNSLNPEYSLQADFGIDITTNIFALQAEAFANRINNYIFSARSATIIDPEYQTYAYKQGHAFLYGFEAHADIKPLEWLKIGTMVSYVRGELRTTSSDLPKIPAMQINAHITATAHEQWKMFKNASFSCRLNHSCKQNHFYDVDNSESETPEYTLLNISAGTEIAMNKRTIAKIHIIAENIFDVAYQSHLSRLKYTDVNVASGQEGIYDMGRNITIKIAIPIGK